MRTQDPERAETFADWEAVDSWAKEAVSWMVGNYYLNGSSGLLEPAGKATRAQVAQILMNYGRLPVIE